jgi:hypothetical protein
MKSRIDPVSVALYWPGRVKRPWTRNLNEFLLMYSGKVAEANIMT